MVKSKAYDNDSISSLKGADRVRLRPGVIFGSDDLEGCKHSFLKFCLIRSTRHVRASEIRLRSDVSLTALSRSRISAEYSSDYNSKKIDIIGSWFIVSSMQVENIQIIVESSMSSAWD